MSANTEQKKVKIIDRHVVELNSVLNLDPRNSENAQMTKTALNYIKLRQNCLNSKLIEQKLMQNAGASQLQALKSMKDQGRLPISIDLESRAR